MSRVYNFAAGPATLPESILRRAQEELLEWNGQGVSVMEISHRSKPFRELLERAEEDLRHLMAIPANYKVLFLTAPARSQFAMVPMNLLRGKKTADYLVTGLWSRYGAEEAERYCQVNRATDNTSSGSREIAPQSEWQLQKDAAYVYFTSNETVNGVEFHQLPEVGDVPLVVDMTSSFLSRPVDVSRYGLIYAGAQKNIAPAGLTIVIVREDLLGNMIPTTPSVYDYQLLAEKQSLYYTANTFACYMAALMFSWLKEQGGLVAMAELNQRKASKLYACIDESDFYSNDVALDCRSLMNIPFRLKDESLNDAFLQQAADKGLAALKGHRTVGGMRASIYNAMPEAGVDALVAFMQDFRQRHG